MISFNKNAITVSFLIVCLLCIGCGPKSSNAKSSREKQPGAIGKKDSNISAQNNADGIERFEAFFEKFKSDSIFQKSRIEFPLKYIVLGEEDGKDSTKFVSKNEMTYIKLFTLHEKDKIIKKVSLNPTKVKIRFQIEDTGYEKDFTFFMKSGKWYLVLVEDASD